MPLVAPAAAHLPAGWRVSDPGHLWSVTYRRDGDGAGSLDIDPPRLASTLRNECYCNGIDVGGDAVAVLRILVVLMAGDGRQVALEALPRPDAPPARVVKPRRPRQPRPPRPPGVPCPICHRYRRVVPNLRCDRCGDSGRLQAPVAGDAPE